MHHKGGLDVSDLQRLIGPRTEEKAMKKRITQFSFEAIVLTALTAVTTLTFGVLINAMSSIHAIA